MRLIKNGYRYIASKRYAITEEELKKVTWHILNSKYRTNLLNFWSGCSYRLVELPDKSKYTIFETFDYLNSKKTNIEYIVGTKDYYFVIYNSQNAEEVEYRGV